LTRELAIIEKLEKDLSLKQLQIRSLLMITQAINDNVSQEGLFDMYRSFLSWEMGIEKMLLLIYSDSGWLNATDINMDLVDVDDLINVLKIHKRLHTVKNTDPKCLQVFNIVIPVFHKEYPIAYSLIGGIKEKEDLYNKIQFITTITNIVSVAIENKRLFKRQIEQERYSKEMELATEVQSMLMPENLPKNSVFELSKIYKPHYNIGGDYIDYIKYDEDRFALCIADISGKGVSAALLMANFQAMIQSLIFQYKDLETFVFALNQAVYRITKSDRFITFFVCEINIKLNKLRYVNAGHYPPVLQKLNGEVLRLESGCSVIGAFDKLPEIKEETVTVSKGDLLVCFTDGLADLQSKGGEYFEEKGLLNFIQAHSMQSADEFNELLLVEINEFTENDKFFDDIAVLTFKMC
jgi:sigma-B regulation protein RsbU (phosphoserine phosphatase)